MTIGCEVGETDLEGSWDGANEGNAEREGDPERGSASTDGGKDGLSVGEEEGAAD